MGQTAKFLPALNALRGLAAFMVVLFHAKRLLAPDASLPFVLRPLERGYLWVDLFFVLSGYVMVHVYGAWFSKSVEKQYVRMYWQNRLARIYPLHLLTLFILVGYALIRQWMQHPVQAPEFQYAALPTNLLLIQSWGIHTHLTWNAPAWSISSEWAMYLLFPWLMLRSSRSPLIQFRLLITIPIIIYVLVEAMNPLHNLDATFDWGILRALAGFLFGVMLYEVHTQRVWASVWARKEAPFVVLTGLLLSFYFAPSDVAIVLFWPVVIWMLLYQQGWLERLLNTKPLQYLGDISYSVYMLHYPLLILMATFLPQTAPLTYRLGAVSSFIVATLLLSALSYHLFEMPLRHRFKAKPV